MEACMNQATVARYAASCSECEEVNYVIGAVPGACVACDECGASIDPLDYIHVDDVATDGLPLVMPLTDAEPLTDERLHGDCAVRVVHVDNGSVHAWGVYMDHPAQGACTLVRKFTCDDDVDGMGCDRAFELSHEYAYRLP